MLKELKNAISKIGKPQWQDVLMHLADLHGDSIHPPFFQLPYQWEEIAPKNNGEMHLLFGNWDTVHIALDLVFIEPKHAMHQILNHLALQEENGLVPGYVSLIDNQLRWSHYITSPPLWPYAANEYFKSIKNLDSLKHCYEALRKQIQWFEENRRHGEGFYYVDRLDHLWESGVEEGVRSDSEGDGDGDEEMICVDATSHMFALYSWAESWSRLLNIEACEWEEKAKALALFIQQKLFDDETGFFHDRWSIKHPYKRTFSFEGMWPIVVGAATSEQAQRVINENLLDTTRFFTEHPIPSVGMNDPRFEYRHWRGPTRNSMTFWAAKGCMNYARYDAATVLLERALDATVDHFKMTGSLWEFYHPQGKDPRSLSRLSRESTPIPNYLGHNPLIAMACLWDQAKARQN